jgi:acyl carrier protein
MFEIARKLLAEQLNMPIERITAETAFSELEANSTDIEEIITALEDIYDIEFQEDDPEYYPTLEALVETLYGCMQQVKR